jgi:hypothetical protein
MYSIYSPVSTFNHINGFPTDQIFQCDFWRLLTTHIDGIRRRHLSLTAVVHTSWLGNLKIFPFRTSDQIFCIVPNLTAAVKAVN